MPCMCLWLCAGLGTAQAEEPEEANKPSNVDFSVSGHVKMFGMVSFPYEVELPDELLYDLLNPLPTEPTAQAFLGSSCQARTNQT